MEKRNRHASSGIPVLTFASPTPHYPFWVLFIMCFLNVQSTVLIFWMQLLLPPPPRFVECLFTSASGTCQTSRAPWGLIFRFAEVMCCFHYFPAGLICSRGIPKATEIRSKHPFLLLFSSHVSSSFWTDLPALFITLRGGGGYNALKPDKYRTSTLITQ